MLSQFVFVSSLPRYTSWMLVLLVGSLPAWGAPGDLDATFGTRGVVAEAQGLPRGATAVLLQPDGKLIAVGEGAPDFNLDLTFLAVARFNADGTPDTAFGNNGAVLTQLGDFPLSLVPSAVLQTDGRILVAAIIGMTVGDLLDFRLALVRYLTDGSLDTAFGAGGIVLLPDDVNVDGQPFRASVLYSLVLEPDGKSVVSGFGNLGGALIRFNIDGSLDASFGRGGVALIGTPASPIEGVAAVQADGKLIVGDIFTSNGAWQVARFDDAGLLDPAFGSGGIALAPVTAPPALIGFGVGPVGALLVQPDGKLIVSGRGEHFVNPAYYDLVATRLNPDGSVDREFAGGAGAVTPLGVPVPVFRVDPFSTSTAAVLQPDGKLVLIGLPWD